MTQEAKLLALHAVCVITIITCFALSATLFSGQPVISQALVGAGFFLWGKLGFRPSRTVFERHVQALEAGEVVRILSSRPPPLAIPGLDHRKSAEYPQVHRPRARAQPQRPVPPPPRGHKP